MLPFAHSATPPIDSWQSEAAERTRSLFPISSVPPSPDPLHYSSLLLHTRSEPGPFYFLGQRHTCTGATGLMIPCTAFKEGVPNSRVSGVVLPQMRAQCGM